VLKSDTRGVTASGAKGLAAPAVRSSSCGRGAERVYGIPPEQVIGSTLEMKFETEPEENPMDVSVETTREGDHAHLLAIGPFDLAHAASVATAVEGAESGAQGCATVDLDLRRLERLDGAGAVLLARLLDRLHDAGQHTRVMTDANPEAGRLIDLYRACREVSPTVKGHATGVLTRIGATAAQYPGQVVNALDFTGRSAASLPKALVAPASVDWRSLPGLLQEIGADALLVTGAANLLVGVIIGFLGVSQLGRFGVVSYVAELVVVAHFRELGPLVTAIVVAGRSGAGIASEIATMKVSEEIDALRSMGFDPVRWLVIPRCVALAVTLPLLTWVGDVLALFGGLAATTAITDMTARAYVLSTLDAITPANFFGGLVKSPFLGLAIGLIACGQGLAASGGAAAVGARTTTAVVLAIFGVIVINALFTLFLMLLGL
jgi:phospholipid/cholesterol/gamma-HCH transport system permease protein